MNFYQWYENQDRNEFDIVFPLVHGNGSFLGINCMLYNKSDFEFEVGYIYNDPNDWNLSESEAIPCSATAVYRTLGPNLNIYYKKLIVTLFKG